MYSQLQRVVMSILKIVEEENIYTNPNSVCLTGYCLQIMYILLKTGSMENANREFSLA